MKERPILFSAPMVRAILAGQYQAKRKGCWEDHARQSFQGGRVMADVEVYRRLRAGTLRLVRNPKRRRALQRRGVYLWWNNDAIGWLWDPAEDPRKCHTWNIKRGLKNSKKAVSKTMQSRRTRPRREHESNH